MKNIQKVARYSAVLTVLIASFFIPIVSFAQYYYPLQVFCNQNTNSVQMNTIVGWSAGVSGGSGIYTYSWSGTDGLFGNTNPVYMNYINPGVKTASVIVTSSDGQSRVASCGSVNVYPVTYASLQISCHPNTDTAQTNTSVGWSASGVGGNGNYTYSWSGTDGLSGNLNSVSQIYNTAGTKAASITVTSGDGQSATANCGSVYVYPPQSISPYYGALSGTCSADVSSTNIGNTVNWSGYGVGGNGIYTYSWSDSDGYASLGQYFSRSYPSAGNKYMTLTISSAGQSISRICSVYVMQNSSAITPTYPTYQTQNQVLSYNDVGTNLSSVYLSDVPYTGFDDVARIILFISMLILWSAILAYILLKNKKNSEVLVAKNVSSNSDKIGINFSQDENELKQIGDYARTQKVLLSESALIKIFKLAKLGKINASEVIRGESKGDWTSVGEKDLDKYL